MPMASMSPTVITTVSLPRHLEAGPRAVPAANRDLHEVGRPHVRDIRGMEEMGGVHSLIHVALLDIDMPIEVDDPEIAVDERRNAADVRIGN